MQHLRTSTEYPDTVATEFDQREGLPAENWIIPPDRVRYLADIAKNNRDYDEWAQRQSEIAQRMFRLRGALDGVERVVVAELNHGQIRRAYGRWQYVDLESKNGTRVNGRPLAGPHGGAALRGHHRAAVLRRALLGGAHVRRHLLLRVGQRGDEERQRLQQRFVFR